MIPRLSLSLSHSSTSRLMGGYTPRPDSLFHLKSEGAFHALGWFFRCRYGKWGYGFGRAPFSISGQKYEECVGFIRCSKLDDLHADFAGVDEGVQNILKQYASLSTPNSPG